MMTVDEYLELPWTIDVALETDDDQYYAVSVAELPGFTVAGRTQREIDERFWAALRLFLETYLDSGETPPRPSSLSPREVVGPYARSVAPEEPQTAEGAKTGSPFGESSQERDLQPGDLQPAS